MSIAMTINLALIILCAAVLVQCERIGRSLHAFRQADLPGTAAALNGATEGARRVLAEIRQLLADEAAPRIAALEKGAQVADELAVMVGIANATADRLLENARAANAPAPAERQAA